MLDMFDPRKPLVINGHVAMKNMLITSHWVRTECGYFFREVNFKAPLQAIGQVPLVPAQSSLCAPGIDSEVNPACLQAPFICPVILHPQDIARLGARPRGTWDPEGHPGIRH